MLDTIILWDTQLFLALNQAGVSWLDGPMILISEVWIWIPLYAAILFFIFKKFPLADAIIFTAICVVGVILTDQGSVHLFKEKFKRLRPCQLDELRDQMRFLADGCGLYGFVSSHAANTFGFAIIAGGIFRNMYPKLGVILLIWAVIVSYSRIYLGVHYPLDIICGALLGVAIGRLLLILVKRRLMSSEHPPA